MLTSTKPSLDLWIAQVRLPWMWGLALLKNLAISSFVMICLFHSSFESEHIYVIPSAFIAAVMGSREDWIDPFNDVSRDLQEVALVLQGHQRAPRAVVHRNLERLHQRSKGLDISLNAQVPKYHKARQHRLFLDGGVHRHDERDTCFTGHVIAEQVYALNMEIRRVHLLRDANLDLLRRQVSKSPLDRFAHCSIDAPAILSFPVPGEQPTSRR